MGAGKSTVAGAFEEMGARLIDADRMGKDLLADPGLKAGIVKAFGAGVVGPDGGIDAARLGRAAFASRASARTLDRLTRKLLIEKIRARIEEMSSSAQPIVVDAALLPEWNAAPWLDVLVVVDSSEARAIQRAACGRFSEAEARGRMGHQFSRARKAKAADVLIVNDGSLEELKEKARKVYCTLVGDSGWRLKGRE